MMIKFEVIVVDGVVIVVGVIVIKDVGFYEIVVGVLVILFCLC